MSESESEQEQISRIMRRLEERIQSDSDKLLELCVEKLSDMLIAFWQFEMLPTEANLVVLFQLG